MNSNPEGLKRLILNSQQPFILKNVLDSKLLTWTLEDWKSALKDKELEFRCGIFSPTSEPQWERTSEVVKESFDYFLKHAESETNWLYFDYKYLNEWLTDIKSLQSDISWAPLGFPNINTDESTIWIGSKGAHTPCHVDTYGFNLIFQIFGKKLWIISPPEENLKPTRIPYEESSIYSKLNFFSPSVEEFKGLNNFRKVILHPGDVLFLPHKWWHYVENLETAISVNTWIPSPEDDEERFKESVVQLLVKQFTISNDKMSRQILNPNMEKLVLCNSFDDMLDTIFTCKEMCINKENKTNKKCKTEDLETNNHSEESHESVSIEKYPFVEKVSKMSQSEFSSFLEGQRNRFKENPPQIANKGKKGLELLQILTDSDVIALISEKMLESRNSDL